jgi:hypothetical protein
MPISQKKLSYDNFLMILHNKEILEYQAHCPEPFHDIQGPVHEPFFEERAYADSHDNNLPRGTHFVWLLVFPKFRFNYTKGIRG